MKQRARLSPAAVLILVSASCTSGDRTTGPAVPSSITPASSVQLSAVVGTALPDSVTVKVTDRAGAAIPSVPVTWSVAEGDGAISASSAPTDAEGMARVAWRLGTAAGENRLVASVSGLTPVTFVATGMPDEPVDVAPHAGDAQEATVGTPLSVAPAVIVRDRFGNATPGVPVEFSVSAGGGTLSGETATTDAEGIAAAAGWLLGTLAGEQSVDAIVAGVGSARFTATARPAGPKTLEIASGNGQRAGFGTAPALAPTVLVLDTFGNAVAGVGVTFTTRRGSGSVAGAVQLTDAQGSAAAVWTLGASGTLNVLEAAIPNGAKVQFVANGTPPRGNGYDIALHWASVPTPAQEAAAEAAAARWRQVVAGDLVDIPFTVSGADCGPPGQPYVIPALNETIDDILIVLDFGPMDGAGGVTAQAAPCFIRTADNLPIVATVRLDAADLELMATNGTLNDVVLHELAHALGFGTPDDLWSFAYFGGLLINRGTEDPFFRGENAVAAFNAAGGSAYVGNRVPVENTGGPGTADAHWRESVLTNELMTGYIDGTNNPLSRVTLASLVDMGYEVNMSAADNYSYAAGAAAAAAAGARGMRLVEGPVRARYVVDTDGRVRRLR